MCVGQFGNLETVRECWQDARSRIRGEQRRPTECI